MVKYNWFLFPVVFILTCLQDVLGQSPMCLFEGLQAECLYKFSAQYMSTITAKINVCDHPISLTLTIKGESQDFSHTFDGVDTMIMLHKYRTESRLQVRLVHKPDSILNVEVYFFLYGDDLNFIHQDVDLSGQNFHCFLLNDATKIAIGVASALLVVVIVMAAFLVYIHYFRRKRDPQTAFSTVSSASHDDHGFTPSTMTTV